MDLKKKKKKKEEAGFKSLLIHFFSKGKTKESLAALKNSKNMHKKPETLQYGFVSSLSSVHNLLYL